MSIRKNLKLMRMVADLRLNKKLGWKRIAKLMPKTRKGTEQHYMAAKRYFKYAEEAGLVKEFTGKKKTS